MYPAAPLKCLDVHTHIYKYTYTHTGRRQPLELDLHCASSCLRSDYSSPHGMVPHWEGGGVVLFGGWREKGRQGGEKEHGMLHSVGQGVLYTSRTMGPSTSELLSKTLSGEQKEGQTESWVIHVDEKTQNLSNFMDSRSPDVTHGVTATLKAAVTQCNLSLRVYFISFLS